MALEFLLRYWQRTGDDAALSVVVHTLDQMARGGIYDQLGGGFHRYSTDAEWLVPHFEKMLYDNAQLAPRLPDGLPGHGQRVLRTSRRADHRLRPARHDRSVGRLLLDRGRRLRRRGGQVLRLDAGRAARRCWARTTRVCSARFYDVTERGNFEGRASILHVDDTPREVARRSGVTEAELLAALERGRPVLFEARAQRVRPARDEKVLAAWNGMMLRALAEAARCSSAPISWRRRCSNAEFLLLERCARPTARCFGPGSPATRRS